MKKKLLKQILWILSFIVIGGIIGYFIALGEHNRQYEPAFIEIFISQGLEVPEPIEYSEAMFGFALLFSGIPTGLILFKQLSYKWLTWYSKPISEVIIGVVMFPFYTAIGAVISIPMLIWKIYCFIKK